MGIDTSCVSRFQPFGKSGRRGRSIMRAVRVAFSPALPSRRKKLPGILPAAYIRSSTSTVSGRKSTSRRFPAVAVARTIVSPAVTTTAPLACLASLPVSKATSVPPTSTETRLTPSFILFLSAPPPVGGTAFSALSRVGGRLAAGGTSPGASGSGDAGVERHAAVHEQRRAGHVARLGGREPGDRRR